MTKDITFCVTGNCKLKNSCQRNCIGKPIKQDFISMAEFRPNNSGTCDFYIPKTDDDDDDDNQSAKADKGKPRLSLVPPELIYAVARVREYGNSKYPQGGENNWRTVEPRRYIDALLRHIYKYIENPDSVDEESGLSHLDHAGCNIAFLIALEGDVRGCNAEVKKEGRSE